jgi:hypothetical protein
VDQDEDGVVGRCGIQGATVAVYLLLVHNCLGEAEIVELVILRFERCCGVHDCDGIHSRVFLCKCK